MRALVVERDYLRFAAARIAGAILPGGGSSVGPLRLRDLDAPELPGPGWVRVSPMLSGICGSDLALVDGRSSPWFEPIVSFPFVPGHEVVGTVDRTTRVVVEPVLGCVARGHREPCPACLAGDLGRCGRLVGGAVSAGLQTGFCCDTGGGWSEAMVAHESQLHEVPGSIPDRAAVLIEPTACAVHAAASARVGPDETVMVLGAGTLGLLAVAALRHIASPRQILVTAKYEDQRRLAIRLGADQVDEPTSARRAARRASGTVLIGSGSTARLAEGIDVVIDCVGSDATIADSLAVVRPGGRVLLVGMPAPARLDLTPLWQREVSLSGTYAYGTEHSLPGEPRTFDVAISVVSEAQLGDLVTATYPLEKHGAALTHAASAGSRGAVKIAFDLRSKKRPG